jgi:aldehyde dehydrogenase (NAD+)/aldehyde dehydrogenase
MADNVSPVDGEFFKQAARSTQEDVDLALDDAAHRAFPSWSTTSVTERSNMLKIAQVMETIECQQL